MLLVLLGYLAISFEEGKACAYEGAFYHSLEGLERDFFLSYYSSFFVSCCCFARLISVCTRLAELENMFVISPKTTRSNYGCNGLFIFLYFVIILLN